jgi:hypothetical protein
VWLYCYSHAVSLMSLIKAYYKGTCFWIWPINLCWWVWQWDQPLRPVTGTYTIHCYCRTWPYVYNIHFSVCGTWSLSALFPAGQYSCGSHWGTDYHYIRDLCLHHWCHFCWKASFQVLVTNLSSLITYHTFASSLTRTWSLKNFEWYKINPFAANCCLSIFLKSSYFKVKILRKKKQLKCIFIA